MRLSKFKMRKAIYSIVVCFSLLVGLTLGSKDPAPTTTEAKAAAAEKASGSSKSGQVKYQLDKNVKQLYPDQSWLPAPYKNYYKDLDATIKMFTEQSLKRDGIPYKSLTVKSGVVTIESSDAKAKTYETMHPNLLKIGVAGLNGVKFCQESKGCWDPNQIPKEPWALFLPLGLPLVNQKSVLFLDYPPAVSLTPPSDKIKSQFCPTNQNNADYLCNFTMWRWQRVLQAVGIAESSVYLYETIVDSRPIAAPGSGQEVVMPDPTTYFNQQKSSPDRFYITPMLKLLTDPPTNKSTSSSLPVAVLGGPARKAWKQVINQAEPGVLDVGTTKLPGSNKSTPWVAGNHPDVTAYQCCPGDKNKKCYDQTEKQWSDKLVENEKKDLMVACIIRALGDNPGAKPETIKAQCTKDWDTNPSSSNQQTICIQAKLDYDFTTDGNCKTPDAARAFCQAYKNNACPTNIFTCEVPTKKQR